MPPLWPPDYSLFPCSCGWRVYEQVPIRLSDGVVLLGLVLGGSARADSFTYDSIAFAGSVTNTTATLTIQCTDATVCGGIYLGDVTLKGLNYSGSPTLVSAPAGYHALGGGQNNSAVGSGGGCNNKDASGGVCWRTSLPTRTNALHFQRQHQQWHGKWASSRPGNWILKRRRRATGRGKVFAISNDLSSLPVSSVSEPGTFTLLAAGLFAIALLGRKARQE